jgi:hypothetical protein
VDADDLVGFFSLVTVTSSSFSDRLSPTSSIISDNSPNPSSVKDFNIFLPLSVPKPLERIVQRHSSDLELPRPKL